MGRNNQQRRKAKAKARRERARASSPRQTGSDWWVGDLFGSRFGAAGDRAEDGASFGRQGAASFGRPSADASVTARAYELAVAATRAGSPGQREAAGAGMRRMVQDRGGARALEQVAVACIRDLLDQAWGDGWEPADLHRLAGRRGRVADQALLADAMAENIGRFADAAVDPRWHAQLTELDATSRWPEHQTYLGAGAQASSWDQVIDPVVTVLSLLGSLPVLEPLGPVPGEYTRPRHGQAPVDDRVLSRVRALLAKAESTTFPAEAETFTAGAQSLMARHSIDAALLASTARGDADAPAARRIGIDAPYEAPKALLLTEVADANRCRTVWSKQLGFVTVLGFEADLDAVETLFTSLLVQATSAVSRAGARTDRYGRSRTRSFRQSFLSAFAQRIGERLREATDQVTDAVVTAQASTTGPDGAGGGRALVPLLARRARQVDETVERMFPQLTHAPVRPGADDEGWASGRRAADQAALNRGVELEERRGA